MWENIDTLSEEKIENESSNFSRGLRHQDQ